LEILVSLMNNMFLCVCFHAFSDDFTFFIVDDTGNHKWAQMLEIVPNSNRRVGPKEVPLAYLACAGTPTQDKQLLGNAMLVDWQLRVKKQNLRAAEECPWFQPTSQGVDVRTFMGDMKKTFNWQFGGEDLKNFKGSLEAVTSKEFQRRYEEWVSDICFIFIVLQKWLFLTTNVIFI